MILEMLTVGPFQENCYIIGDEESGIGALVDPGDEAARIALAVEQTGLDIGSIIITHAHIDHVGAVAALVDEYACPVLMHAEAEPMLKQLPTQAMMMGLRFGKVPTVDRYIEDEEVLEVGGSKAPVAVHARPRAWAPCFLPRGRGARAVGRRALRGERGKGRSSRRQHGGPDAEHRRAAPDAARRDEGALPGTAARPRSGTSGPQPVLAGRDVLSESVHKHRESAPETVRVAILTISDTRTPETDTGGRHRRGAHARRGAGDRGAPDRQGRGLRHQDEPRGPARESRRRRCRYDGRDGDLGP